MVVDSVPGSPRAADQISSPGQFSALMSMVSAVQPDFGRVVDDIARSGLAALPTADGVGVAVLEDGKLTHLGDTDDFVAVVDDAQYAAMRGPCVTAAQERRTVVAPAPAEKGGWPELAPHLRAAGVQSALSIPLTVEDRLIGTLNVYARRPDAFDAETAARGESFATPAAAALQRALVAQQARRAAVRLGEAVAGRRAVNRTVGLLMGQDGLEAAEAHAHLAGIAEAGGQDLVAAARELWDQRVASGRPVPGRQPVGAGER